MAPRVDSGKSDADLVAESLLGAKEPFAELVTRHWDTAVALAARVLGTAELARDAAQEAAVSAMTSLDRLRSPDRFGAWFCGIALNVARRWLRQLRSETLRPLLEQASDAPGPAELAEIADLAGRVRGAITTLPRGQRDAVLLFYLQGLSHREVAAELGISAGAVKARLHQARAALAPMLSQLADQQEVRAMNVAAAPDWIEVSVGHVLRTGDQPNPRHIMLLQESGGTRRLPIWIGPAEATAMALTLESAEQPRPMTYSLTASILQAAGSPLTEARITRLTGGVYYATVVVDGPGGPREVDARPSDAVNLALIAGVPIRIHGELLSDAQPARSADALAYPTGTAELAAEALAHGRELMREFERCEEQAPGAD